MPDSVKICRIKDCSECPYPDCIAEESWQDANRRYRLNYIAKIGKAEYNRRINELNKKNRQKNKAEYNRKMVEYHQKNRAEYNRKMAEYRKRKREEKASLN